MAVCPRTSSAPDSAATQCAVLLLVDSSDTITKIVTPLRAALQALIDGVPAEDEIALVTMGRQLRIRVQPTTDRKRLKDEAGRLFSDGGGTVLLDSLLEANDRILSKAVDRQAAIVILTTDGPESSSSTREEQFNKFVTDLGGQGRDRPCGGDVGRHQHHRHQLRPRLEREPEPGGRRQLRQRSTSCR